MSSQYLLWRTEVSLAVKRTSLSRDGIPKGIPLVAIKSVIAVARLEPWSLDLFFIENILRRRVW